MSVLVLVFTNMDQLRSDQICAHWIHFYQIVGSARVAIHRTFHLSFGWKSGIINDHAVRWIKC